MLTAARLAAVVERVVARHAEVRRTVEHGFK